MLCLWPSYDDVSESMDDLHSSSAVPSVLWARQHGTRHNCSSSLWMSYQTEEIDTIRNIRNVYLRCDFCACACTRVCVCAIPCAPTFVHTLVHYVRLWRAHGKPSPLLGFIQICKMLAYPRVLNSSPPSPLSLSPVQTR